MSTSWRYTLIKNYLSQKIALNASGDGGGDYDYDDDDDDNDGKLCTCKRDMEAPVTE